MFSLKFILITQSLSYVVALHNSNPIRASMGTKDEIALVQPAQEEAMFRRSLASIDVERTLESVLELVHVFRIMYPKKSVIVQQSVYEMYDPQTKRRFGEAFDALEHILMVRENRIKLRSIFNNLLDHVKSGGLNVPPKQNETVKLTTSIPVVSAGSMPSDSNASKMQNAVLKPMPSILDVKSRNKLRDSNAFKVQGVILKPRPSISEDKDRNKLRDSNAFKAQDTAAKRTSSPVIKAVNTAKLATSSQVNSIEIKKPMTRTRPVSSTLKTKRSATSTVVKERKPATPVVTGNQKLSNAPTIVDREQKIKSSASEYDLLANVDPAEMQRKFEMASAMLQEALAKDEYLRLDNFETSKLGNQISKQKKSSISPSESTPKRISSSRNGLDQNVSYQGYQRNRRNTLDGLKSKNI